MRICTRFWALTMLAMPLSVVAGWGQGGSTPLTQAAYTIGGTVDCLTGCGLTGRGLVLQDNGGNNLSVTADGVFTFSKTVASGATYKVTVLVQPTGESCAVSDGSGTASANVTNVEVWCTIVYYTVGGTISGLAGTGLVLEIDGLDRQCCILPVTANGAFTFGFLTFSGYPYYVTVLTQPKAQTCRVTNGSGTATADVKNVKVGCTNFSTVGGTVSGLTGTGLVLQDNGGSNLSVKANGAFTFSKSVASDAAYNVTILTQPKAQVCAVSNGSGEAWVDVTNVQVGCVGGKWAWMGGSDTAGSNGFGGPAVYGTLGTPASTNVPGGRSSAVAWSDASGNLWLFGGYGAGLGASELAGWGWLNDLWKFDPKLGKDGEWTWMGGSPTVQGECVEYGCGQPGVYGTLGTAAATNIPGGRDHAASWSDASGNLWLFGGNGFDSAGTQGELDDLWKFDPKSGEFGEWTWMGGSRTTGSAFCGDLSGNCGRPGVYGTLGTAAETNIPGGRDSSVTWIDASGNLWLFGGGAPDSTGNYVFLNDLWKFDPKLGKYGEWTWMGGSSTIGSNGGQPGVYGTLGTAASRNIPGARDSAVSWSDASGNLWLFGGWGFDATGNGGYLNDLWKFDPELGKYGEWAWMGGSNWVPGVYGALGMAAPANIPGGREWAVSWSDASDRLWLFGGYDGCELNDLWKFDAKLGENGEWAWMGGSTTSGEWCDPGVYGTLGTAAVTNIPTGRLGAVSWSDASGHLWLFGGFGYIAPHEGGSLNDLWEYLP